MNPERTRAAAGERGFVLLGVVVMVLALTIIGVSLYALSGYESQFFSRTYFERQALYRASGGIEIVKKLVTTSINGGYRLSNAAMAVGHEGVVSAVAWQDTPPDSTGDLDWNQDVHVRVGVNVFGATRMVEGKYRFVQPNNPYWRLFATTNKITKVNAASNLANLLARGGAWQVVDAPSDSAWIAQLDPPSKIALTTLPTPSPEATSFITAHMPPPLSADTAWVTRDYNPLAPPPRFTNLYVTMDAGPGASAFKYFGAASDTLSLQFPALGTYYDFFSGAVVHAIVRGTAVWVIPRGMRLTGELRVERLPGATTANLVIVVGPNGREPGATNLAIQLEKAIWTPNDDVNVFLVANGTIRLQDGSGSNANVTCRSLCMFADAIQLSGPANGTHRLELQYPPALRDVATDLYGRDLLPRASGVQMSAFTFVKGSWRESAELQ